MTLAFPTSTRLASLVAGGVIALAVLTAGSGTAATDSAFGATGCKTARQSHGHYDARLVGTNASDCLHGGHRADRIKGLRGRDVLNGGGGQDRINARDGVRDLVSCGGGEDTVLADSKDALSGCENQRVTVVDPPVTGGNCGVDPATLTAVGCELLHSDTGEVANPEQLWGDSSCVSDSRVQRLPVGGDTHARALGKAPTEDFYRQLTVLDGDDFYGERCELGINEHRYGDGGGDGTFAIYNEGDHEVTFMSVKIPDSLPLMTPHWQTIAQMKQTQPSAAGGGEPILELQLRDGQFYLDSPFGPYWTTDAHPGVWTRIALDVNYSQDPSRGTVTMYIDSNGDGDATDPGEQSPVTKAQTLKTEVAGGEAGDGIAPGEPIPSHLRMGVYHDPEIACPGGCSIDLDNVEVVG